MKKSIKEDQYEKYRKIENALVRAFGRTLVDLGITERSTLYDVYRIKCRDFLIEELDKIKV